MPIADVIVLFRIYRSPQMTIKTKQSFCSFARNVDFKYIILQVANCTTLPVLIYKMNQGLEVEKTRINYFISKPQCFSYY